MNIQNEDIEKHELLNRAVASLVLHERLLKYILKHYDTASTYNELKVYLKSVIDKKKIDETNDMMCFFVDKRNNICCRMFGKIKEMPVDCNNLNLLLSDPAIDTSEESNKIRTGLHSFFEVVIDVYVNFQMSKKYYEQYKIAKSYQDLMNLD